MNQRFISGAGLAVLAAGVLTAWAGMGYGVKCKACDFKARVTFGGGRMFDQITLWCDGCTAFVPVRWNRRTDPKPGPMGTVWDAESGRKIPVYACPTCKKPAAEVAEPVKRCPKCGKEELDRDPNAPEMAID